MNLINASGVQMIGSGRAPIIANINEKPRRTLGVTAVDLAKAKRLLKNYPNIGGKIVAAKRLAVIEFEGGSSWLGLGPNCPRSKSFVIKKRQARAN